VLAPAAINWVPARQIFTKADDGLRQEWHGLVFMNPPIETETGAVKANPLLMVEVSCRALCSRLLGKLRAPEDKPRMGRPPSVKASF
jgi:hypothetical protein